MIFDTHAHYDDEAFDEDREELLLGFPEGGIEAAVNVAADPASNERTLELIRQYPFLYGTVGVHPDHVKDLDEEKLKWLAKAAQEPKIVAIGEIGLDYYWKESDPEVQKHWFSRQLDLAEETGLPVVVHSRDAAKDTLDMMKSHRAERIGGVIHCFSYGKELAKEYLNMGLYLGIGGVCTFKNGKKLKEVVEYAPIEQIVLETDSPYLAPEPNRGKRNSSLNLPYVVNAIAAIKQMEPEQVIAITTQNARRMYRLPILRDGYSQTDKKGN